MKKRLTGMIRRHMTILLILVLVMSAAACGKKNASSDSVPEVTEEASAGNGAASDASADMKESAASKAESSVSESADADKSDKEAGDISKEEPPVEEVIDYAAQIKIITDNFDKWSSGSMGAYTVCAVTNLDDNKRLEIVAALENDGRSYVSVWEVNKELNGLVSCTENVAESSFPNLVSVPMPIKVYRGVDGLNHYFLETTEPGAGSNVYHNVMPVTLADQVLTIGYLGVRAEENGSVTYRSLDGYEYSEDEFYHGLMASLYGDGTYADYSFPWVELTGRDGLYEKLMAMN